MGKWEREKMRNVMRLKLDKEIDISPELIDMSILSIEPLSPYCSFSFVFTIGLSICFPFSIAPLCRLLLISAVSNDCLFIDFVSDLPTPLAFGETSSPKS